MAVLRPLGVCLGLLLAWQLLVLASGVPPYILPAPLAVGASWVGAIPLLLHHAGITLTEMLLGFAFGTLLGMASAMLLAFRAALRPWLLPLLVASQAVPVFALAPILVLWLGYGLASKVAMATLIIFFPVTATFYDGLRRTEPGWLDLAKTMNARPWAVLWRIRVPSALPALASGLRTAAAVVPIGAVVGEWVGSSGGLGYLMLQANARMKVDLMFAALATLMVMALVLYFLLDWALRRAVPWQSDALDDGHLDNRRTPA